MGLGFKVTFTLRTLLAYSLDFWQRRRVRYARPLHIVFGTMDHYEPGSGGVDEKTERERVDRLLKMYPVLARRHTDAFGNFPKRTWFFPPHYHRHFNLKKLVSLCEAGFGEIELHYHHGKARPDTAENLEKGIRQTVTEYARFGIFGTQAGARKYAFIHGDWALNNSRHGQFCGVNDEISVLLKTGCYADFTFPSLNESNPAQINRIFYATSTANRPKGHTRGQRAQKGKTSANGLLLVQGPVYPFWKNRGLLSLRIFGDAIDGDPEVTGERIDAWVYTGIHVADVPEVVFVKTHTHGAVYESAVLGDEMEHIFAYLETHYNDGKNTILHYATAREMVNMIHALEAGEDPANLENFRDYSIAAPRYNSSPDIEGASDELRGIVFHTYGEV